METILNIIQDAADELKVTRPLSLVGSSLDSDRQFLGYLRSSARAMLGEHVWPELVRQHTFSLVSGQRSYALPVDFERQLEGTGWDASNLWPLVGPVSPQHYELRVNGISQVTPRREFRVFGSAGTSQFYVHPTPDAGSAGEVLSYEYLSRNWIRPRSWASGVSYSDGDYVWTSANGSGGSIYRAVGGGTSGSTKPVHSTGTVSDGGVSWLYEFLLYDRPVRDDDVVVLDADALRHLVKAVWREANGFDGKMFRLDYLKRIEVAASNTSGANRVNMTGSYPLRFVGTESVPDTGYGS